jgi:hypothetical protein
LSSFLKLPTGIFTALELQFQPVLVCAGRKPFLRGNDMSLYRNIHNKRKSGRPMRKKGAKGAPTAANFAAAARTVNKKKGGKVRK